MTSQALLAVLAIGSVGTNTAPAADPVKRVVWQGALHLGDDPEKYSKVTSAGMGFQVPFKAEAGRLTKLTVTAEGVETQAGNGHYVEVVAHFERQPGKAPAREVPVATFRLKDDAGKERGFAFEFDSGRGLVGATPDYYSVKVRVDTHVGLVLWDDFVVKRIDLEQAD